MTYCVIWGMRSYKQKIKALLEGRSAIPDDELAVVEDPVTFIDSLQNTPAPEYFDPDGNSIVVFDDCMFDPGQKSAALLFSRGRHKGADTLYLTQNLTQVPKVLRENTNLVFMFSCIDGDAVRRAHQCWCSGDIPLAEFRRFMLCMPARWSPISSYCWIFLGDPTLESTGTILCTFLPFDIPSTPYPSI